MFIYSAWQLEEDLEMLRKRELKLFIKGSNEYFYYNRSRLQVKRQHQRMRDFIAGSCAALNPRKWVEECAKKTIKWDPTPAKMRSPGDVSDERGAKDSPKKRKRTSSSATNEDTKPVVEMQGKHEDTGKEDSPPPVKKAKGEAEVEVNDGEVPAGIWTTQPNQEVEGEITNETADSPGYSSKIPTNPEVFDVWFWRHQLQKAVCNDSLPKDKVHSHFSPYVLFPF